MSLSLTYICFLADNVLVFTYSSLVRVFSLLARMPSLKAADIQDLQNFIDGEGLLSNHWVVGEEGGGG